LPRQPKWERFGVKLLANICRVTIPVPNPTITIGVVSFSGNWKVPQTTAQATCKVGKSKPQSQGFFAVKLQAPSCQPASAG